MDSVHAAGLRIWIRQGLTCLSWFFTAGNSTFPPIKNILYAGFGQINPVLS
jgi:hypothetical protein